MYSIDLNMRYCGLMYSIAAVANDQEMVSIVCKMILNSFQLQTVKKQSALTPDPLTLSLVPRCSNLWAGGLKGHPY